MLYVVMNTEYFIFLPACVGLYGMYNIYCIKRKLSDYERIHAEILKILEEHTNKFNALDV
jgi:hypothetical protein